MDPEATPRYNRAGNTVQRGRDYESGLAALLLTRALRQDERARLGVNVQWAGKFDDLVLLLPGPATRLVLLQLKAKESGSVGRQALFSQSGKFSLPKYLASFAEVVKRPEAAELRRSLLCVLYTNAPLAKDVPATDLVAEPELAALLATGPGPVARLPQELVGQLERASNEDPELVREFADRFLLCTGQATEEEIPAVLAQELARRCGLLPRPMEPVDAFLRAMDRHCKLVTDVPYLGSDSEPWAALQAALKRQTRAPNGLRMDEGWVEAAGRRLLRELERTPHVMLAGCAQLRSCALAHVLAQDNLQPLFMAHAKEAHTAIKLWRREPGTLLLDATDCPRDDQLAARLRKGLKHTGRRLVLSSGESGGWLPQALSAPEVALDTAGLGQLREGSRISLLSDDLILQGRPLGAGRRPRFLAEAGPEVASFLLQPSSHLELGSALPPLTAPYVERQLQAEVRISDEVLRDSELPDLFLVEGSSRDWLKYKVGGNDNIGTFHSPFMIFMKYMCCDVGDGIDAFKFLKNVHNNQPLHWLLCSENGLSWVASNGDARVLARYAESPDLVGALQPLGGPRFNERQLLAAGPRLLVLSADPGLGKSSLFQSLAQRALQQQPRRWVLLLNLSELSTQLSLLPGTREQVEKLLEAGARPLEAQLVREAAWRTGECEVFVDAFDEIAPDHLPAAGALLRALVESEAARLFVATRPVTLSPVQKALGRGAVVLGLQPLTHSQQQRLLADTWRQRGLTGPLLEEQAGHLLRQLEERQLLDRGALLTASPLTVTLMATAFEDRLTEGEDFNAVVQEFDSFWLYGEFVSNVFTRHCKDKLRKNMADPGVRDEVEQCIQPKFFREQELAALHLVLTSEQFDGLAIPNAAEDLKKIAARLQDAKEKTGLLVGVAGGQPQFLHRTVAEYLAARWLCHNWSGRRENVAGLPQEPELRGVCAFFDHLVAEGLPLHRAVLTGSLEGRRGEWSQEQARAREKAGRTPLHLAAQAGSTELLEALLELDPELEAEDKLQQTTALYYAADNGQWGAAEILVRRGAKVRADVAQLPAVRRLLDVPGTSAWPAFEAHWPAVNYRADVCFPLHVAARCGDEECARLLLNLGGDPNAADREGWTALHCAAMKRHLRLLALLAEKGADLRAEDSEGLSARRLAEMLGKRESAELLRRLEAGEDPQAAFAAFERDLALAQAAGAGDLQRLALLLSAEPAPTQDALNYALLRAAMKGKEKTARALLEGGAHPNAADGKGRTALHWAARRGHRRLLALLAENGADLRAEDSEGLSARRLAEQCGQTESAELLRRL